MTKNTHADTAPTQALPLDHLVINTRFNTDTAAQLLTELGFTLTPQGRHAFGSVNHLILFKDTYLELIGLPTDGGVLRQEIVASPAGIDGLVYSPQSADEIHEQLTQNDAPVLPLHAFSRDVDIDGITHEASFRTVRYEPGTFEAGRVYYCQHLTPEVVWHEKWLGHSNHIHALSAITVVSSDPARDAKSYAQAAFGHTRSHGDGFTISSPEFRVDVVSPETYALQYGDLGSEALDRQSFFGAIELRVSNPTELLRRIDGLGNQVRSRAWHRNGDAGIAIALNGFNALLDVVYDR